MNNHDRVLKAVMERYGGLIPLKSAMSEDEDVVLVNIADDLNDELTENEILEIIIKLVTIKNQVTMKKYNYLLCEADSNAPFAVISNVSSNASPSNIELINKVGLAVEEEFCHEERVKVVHGSFKEDVYGNIKLSFICDDNGEDIVRDLELKLTTIY